MKLSESTLLEFTKTGLQATLEQCQDSRTHNTLRSVLAATPKEEFEA